MYLMRSGSGGLGESAASNWIAARVNLIYQLDKFDFFKKVAGNQAFNPCLFHGEINMKS